MHFIRPTLSGPRILSALALSAACQLALAGAAEISSDAAIRASVKALNPQASVSSIKNSAIAGVKEVLVGNEVLYFSQDGKHVIQGTLFEAATRRNLTDATLAVGRVAALKQVPSKDMIVFPATVPKRYTVKIVSDIDCGVCRKMHSELAQFSAAGIEIQYLIMPRSGPAGDSARKAIAVYCSANPQKALTDAKSGIDPGNASCPNPINRNIALAQVLGINATPTLVFSDGGVMPGYLPVPAMLAELERRANGAKAAP
jgi:thiol:disulfide interchange protein DsbC